MLISTVENFTVDIKYKNKLKYSNDFTYIPIEMKYLQTPKILIPYGIDKEKNILDILFINIENDKKIKELIFKFNKLYEKVEIKFNKFNVNNFLKDKLMRLKIKKCKIYNQNKEEINNFSNNIYGELIINLDGLWIVKNEIWFNWNILQIKVNEPIYLQHYSFIDTKVNKKHIPPPPPPPPPPPIPSKINNIKYVRKLNNKNNITNKNNMTIPDISLSEVKLILKNLNKINISKN
uniref:Uncharacterized protein n=1 Tax=viral metagenome TaxID=1070528 RepID=A0A6C0CY18_9ZZZZ